MKNKMENNDFYCCPYCHEDLETFPENCEKCKACINRSVKEPVRGDKGKTRGREQFLKNDDFFMALTFLSAQFSTDCKIAACLVYKSEKVHAITGPYHYFTKETKETKFDICEELRCILKNEELDSNYCIYFNVYPTDDIRKILDKYENLKVVYMPDNGQIERLGNYEPFKPTHFSKLKIKPHKSDHLEEHNRLTLDKLPHNSTEEENIDLNNSSMNKYFICVCFLIGMRSKDPAKQVGSCIVNEKNQIVGMGFNHPRNPYDDELFNYDRTQKLSKMVFAEEDAVRNKIQDDLSKCRIYSTIFPGYESVKTICNEGMKSLIYTPTGKLTQSIKYENASMEMFLENEVKFGPYMKHFGVLMSEINFYSNAKKNE